MFEEAGHAYVYLIYGMYWCLNVVTEAVTHGAAVLLRGAEPVEGLDGRMDGPGRLCRAFGLDGTWNRADLTSGPLRIEGGDPVPEAVIGASPRIGVGYAGPWAERPLRFFDTRSRHVSRAPSVRRRARRESPST
jgi:DNA-3-methyladenine glycosylase